MEKIFEKDPSTVSAASREETTADDDDVIGKMRDRLRRQFRLRLAVLVDAIGCLEGGGGPRRDIPKVRREALRWFRSREPHPFSFPSVCDALGIDPERVRTRFLAAHAMPECSRVPQKRVLAIVPVRTPRGKGRIHLRAASADGTAQRIGSRGRAA